MEHTQNRYVQVSIGTLSVWYIKLLLEVYDTVNWSEMGKAIPLIASLKEKLGEPFIICQMWS